MLEEPVLASAFTGGGDGTVVPTGTLEPPLLNCIAAEPLPASAPRGLLLLPVRFVAPVPVAEFLFAADRSGLEVD